MRLAEREARCAPAADRRGDPLAGTAAPALRYLLVERPGAWERSALAGAVADPAVMGELVRRCRAADARLLLVRRAHRDPGTPLRVAVADARPGHEGTWWGTWRDERELLELDPTAPPGRATGEPVLLVCTHGRRDPCCARRGWPVCQALTRAFPAQTWQCSHVGGDRFAANLLVLPHGLYYGRVLPQSALEIVRRHAAGNVLPELLRGRSVFPPAVQAAQHAARLALGEEAIGALPPLSVVERPPYAEVELDHPRGVVAVTVERVETEPVHHPTCRAGGASRLVEHHVRALAVPPGDGASAAV